MKKYLNRYSAIIAATLYLSLMFLPVIPLAFTGCKSTLEPGGAYAPTNEAGAAQPDKPLLAADSSFQLAYTALDTVFKIERDNRAALWKVSPEIKKNLDLLRPRAVAGRDSYFRIRAIYVSTHSDAALSDLKSTLAEVVGLSNEAKSLLPK